MSEMQKEDLPLGCCTGNFFDTSKQIACTMNIPEF
jgi:hypothetical protein